VVAQEEEGTWNMGIVIPFRNRQETPAADSYLADSQEPSRGSTDRKHHAANLDTIDRGHEHLCTRPFATRSEIESLLLDINKPCTLDCSGLINLEDLVVFSPEIGPPVSTSSETAGRSGIQWGDVFLKIGDEYPFIFTLYTRCYARRHFLLHGEMIAPSSKDILLERPMLLPHHLVQAVIKWVNCYYPHLRGLPICLESEEVIRELVCDPGEEIVVPDSTELYFL